MIRESLYLCFALLLCLRAFSGQNTTQNTVNKGYVPDTLIADTFYYTPILDTNNNLNVNHLQYYIDSCSVNKTIFVITPDSYFLDNNQTIVLKSNIYLYCKNVFFNIIFKGDAPVKDIFVINNKINCGIKHLNILTFSQTQNLQGVWDKGYLFANKAIINLNNSNNIILDSLNIKRIFGSGISINNTQNSTFSNCIIDEAWTYGQKSGTQGYSIDINGANSKENIIENNYLNNCRHGIVIQYSANSNWIKKNTTKNMKALKKIWWYTYFDYDYTFDITLHGNYAYANVIEENICYGNLYIDDEHTTNGEYNQLLRNIVYRRLQVDSYYPWTYNQKQIIAYNWYGKLTIKGKGHQVVGNMKME